MAKFEIIRIRGGWKAIQDDLAISAESPHFDRGVIRATITVRNGEAIYYRNNANITSERVRTRIIKSLSEKGITIDDKVIVALDDACRRPPEREPQKKTADAGGGTFRKRLLK